MLARAPLRSNAKRTAVSRPVPLPFPVGGWDASSPLASMPADRAVQLKNWFPQPGWGEVRRGYRIHVDDISTATSSIETLMAWRGPTSSALFAATDTSIYNVTSGTPSAVVTGLTNARWQYVNMTTSAGHYIYMVNGANSARAYNGTTWSTPAVTGVSTSDCIGINVHKRRVWFIQQETTDAWYLATDAIAGAATKFSLGSLFTRGGYLMAMGTWTRDGGAGPDDYAVFVSSEGQIALYQGTDPASANTWAVVGVFDVPPPIGRRCLFKYGADLGIVTMQGVFPLSQLLAVDQSQARRVSLTENISRAFSDAHRNYGDLFGWEACVYPKGTRIIVNVPVSENETAVQYVMNTLTGAWCEFDNHNANCWIVYGDDLYFGGNDGTVYRADTGAVDGDAEIVATGQCAYTALGKASVKRWTMVRPLIIASGTARPSIGVSTDFQETDRLSVLPSIAASSSSVFGTAVFGTAVFGADTNTISDWVGVGAIGSFGSVKFQGRVGVSAQATIALWGTAMWGSSTWGGGGTSDETLRINGFLVLAESGGTL